METSPVIPDKIIKDFKDAFKNADNFTSIVKPEICDVLISTDKYRNPWSSADNRNKEMLELVNTQLIKETKQKQINDINKSLVKDFKKTFFDYHNREAMDSEIIDNLKDKMELSILSAILETCNDNQLSIIEIKDNISI
jgi:hypothetical protein